MCAWARSCPFQAKASFFSKSRQARAIFLGDGEFDGIELQAALQTVGLQYVCRTAKNTQMYEDDQLFSFHDLPVQPDDLISIPNVWFTKEGYGPVNVIAWWEQGYAEPIFLVTNLDLPNAACHWYKKRFRIVDRGIPWRTLTGRQHFYLDHEGYLAWGEHLPTYKPHPDHLMLDESHETFATVKGEKLWTKMLNLITPHGKWSIHSTYSENNRMMTLSRGGYPIWLNDKDAAELFILDNDWVEVFNDNGVFVQRAIVSARIPHGTVFIYHTTERTVDIPKSPLKGKRAGMNNSLTRARLKPCLMSGGYAQFTYAFNYWGPTGVNRDTFIFVHRIEPPEF